MAIKVYIDGSEVTFPAAFNLDRRECCEPWNDLLQFTAADVFKLEPGMFVRCQVDRTKGGGIVESVSASGEVKLRPCTLEERQLFGELWP